MPHFRPFALFGGAITVSLPSNFADVSTGDAGPAQSSIRQVPDTQEVFLAQNGFTSVIFDLLERVDVCETDESALGFHFEEMVDDRDKLEGTIKTWSASQARLAKLPADTPAYTLFSTVQHSQASPTRSHQPVFTAMLFTLVRLEEKKTDIVITVNVPHFPGEYAPDEINFEARRLGPLMEQAFEIRDEIFSSFEIKDWSLFVNT